MPGEWFEPSNFCNRSGDAYSFKLVLDVQKFSLKSLILMCKDLNHNARQMFYLHLLPANQMVIVTALFTKAYKLANAEHAETLANK
uniref:Uncharacterized protein n=1 Tax=Romanomermis culicivorax TaxID=13658 RepID=A0A915KA24_ROMCU